MFSKLKRRRIKAKAISGKLLDLNLKVHLYNSVMFMINLVISRTNFSQTGEIFFSHTKRRYNEYLKIKILNLEKNKEKLRINKKNQEKTGRPWKKCEKR